ncbi:MAG: hypothetical protein Q8Q10_01485 [bacterium]|nr:hypothetical protein [bacterium]
MSYTYTTVKLNKHKISDQMMDISELSKKNKWQFEYNEEVDELTFGLDTMPKKSFLLNINNEINLYVTPDSKVHGMFIEHFANNYIKHNKEFKVVLQVLEKEIVKNKTIKKLSDGAIFIGFENKLAVETLKTLAKRGILVSAF